MHSCIYKGQVNHRRFEPRAHSFTYTLFMMYVDLDELPKLFTHHPAWNVEKPGLASFQRKDHYGDNTKSLSSMVRELVLSKTGGHIDGPIRLLTHFRYFGHIFNPISIYYCFDQYDEKLTHVIAEVTNTPWREQHCYVLTGQQENYRFITPTHRKEFHVSPFMDMNINYQWSIHAPHDRLQLKIESIRNNTKLFDASMNLKKVDLNAKNLKSTLINFPFMTLKVVSAIHLQALKLWLKGINYVPHPRNISR